jgi:cell division protein FtsQ
MKVLMRTPLKFLGVLLGLTLFVLLSVAVQRNEASRSCASIEIELNGPEDLFFIEKEDIRDMLGQMQEDTFQHQKISEIDLLDVERKLSENPYVAGAEVWFEQAGILRVEITQRVPLLRVIHSNGVSHYLDIKGENMPLSGTFTARVPILSGALDATYSEPVETGNISTIAGQAEVPFKGDEADIFWKDVSSFANYLKADEFLSAQIEQIHRNPSGTIELVPKVGDHIIHLGRLEGFQEKLQKLKTFYREGLNYTGWNNYSRIDLDYDGKVFVTKKKNP